MVITAAATGLSELGGEPRFDRRERYGLTWQRSGLDERTSSRRADRAHLLCVQVSSGNMDELQSSEYPERLATSRKLER